MDQVISKNSKLEIKHNGHYVSNPSSVEHRNKTKFTKEQILECRIDHTSEIQEVEPVVTIANTSFAVKGDISIIGGLPKAGKTTIAINMIATGLMEQIPEDLDTLQIRSTYAEDKPIFYIDTEQSRATTNKIRKAVCKFLKVDREPDNLYLINLRDKFKAEDKLNYVLSCMEHYPDTHLWIIDGIADLLKDPNNTEDSFELIAKFMSLSQKLNAPIILYLHENPSGVSKFRGNLGSEAERKCYGAIIVKKDKQKQIHIIEPKYLRDSKDFDTIYGHYDINLGRLASLGPEEVKEYQKQTDPKEKKKKAFRELANRCLLEGSNRILHKEFLKRIMNNYKMIRKEPIKKSTATSWINFMKENEIVEKDEEGKYRLLS